MKFYLVTQLFLSVLFIASQVLCNQNLNNFVDNNTPNVTPQQNSNSKKFKICIYSTDLERAWSESRIRSAELD